MNKVMLTCPFTGCEFEANIDAFNNICMLHPLTGKLLYFHCTSNGYVIPQEYFEHLKTVSLSEAAKILNVSRQRVSAIASKNVIPSKTVNKQTVFLLNDVLNYKHNRKPGAPRKA